LAGSPTTVKTGVDGKHADAGKRRRVKARDHRPSLCRLNPARV
jgi:hypothetical protein